MPQSNHYDTIVIGSGISGLTVASILAQIANQRVLVLERHFKAGGFTHTFRRKQFEWDVGLHYVGNMQPGSLGRRMFDLVTKRKVDWCRIEDPYDQFVYPDLELPVTGDADAFRQTLIDRFPEQAQGIHGYFKDLKVAASWMQRMFAAKAMPSPIAWALQVTGKQLACMTTQAVLLKHFPQHEKLRAIVASQWGNYGLPPSQSAFGIHALIVSDYLQGAYYPSGGAATIAASIEPIIEGRGGAVLVNHRVMRLETKAGRVHQVIVEHKGKSIAYTASRIVSAVGAKTTFKSLLGHESALPEQSWLTSKVPPATAITLYVGLKDDPRSLGFNAGNYWIYDRYDHQRIHENRNLLPRSIIQQTFLSFPSLRSPDTQHHTAELITFADYESWQRWEHQPWLKRDAEYQRLKEDISAEMLRFVDRFKPGFSKLVEYSELSTPLTVTSMTGHPEGAIYGFPATPERFRAGLFPIKTSLKNLFLTGCDTGTLGINGALMAGVMTSACLLGPLGFPRIFRAAR